MGIVHGRMRNLGLSMTMGRFFSRTYGVHPMNRSRGASLYACGEAKHGDRPTVAVLDAVAHLGTDQGLVAAIVVVDEELVPPPAFAGFAGDGTTG